ncbi:MAG: hypothetical protein WD250_05045 [Egibacteraceae bacterium]
MDAEDTGRGRSWWAVAATLLVAAVWALLAGRRPDATYHFAPALVAWAYPYLRLSAAPAGRRQALAAVIGGATAAVIMAFALDAVGWLRGPVLFGGDALGESLLVAGLAALVALVVSIVTTVLRE